MRYAIYGVNRVAKDFLYIFSDIDPVCFFEDGYEQRSYMGKQALDITEVKEWRSSFDKIIVCDFDKENKKKRLAQIGLAYERDYLFEENFFAQLDDKKLNPDNKPIIVWGTGKRAGIFERWNTYYEVVFYIDSNTEKKEFAGKVVKHPDDIVDWKNYFVVIAVRDNWEIINYLSELGMEVNVDFADSQSIKPPLSKMIRQTIFDRSNYDLNCYSMLNHAELEGTGDIYCCCGTFLRNPIGNVEDLSFSKIWNSKMHEIMCLSLVNHTYSFCIKEMCPLFVGKEAGDVFFEPEPYRVKENYPTTIAVSHDSTCNLKCVSCRKDVHVAVDKELENVKKYTGIIKTEMLAHAEFFIMAGNGEVFFGRGYQDLYKSDILNRTKYIRLLTNGMFFNERNWEEFTKNKEGKIILTVSIDAASKDTYEKIRRGGNFDILKSNMAFAAKLRKEGKLAYFRMNFVVQRENYREMPMFVRWGEELGVDEVFFTKILNWGTYTKEEFREISMMEEDEVTPKVELKEVLEDPIMCHPIVDLGTIQYCHREVDSDKIENYYRWELERSVKDLFGD